ncbi:reverse transcriptase family protein [Flavobacterium sp. RSSA_27]|uniref:reverse transcriptase family protein n=1 Tax=Flavobacterium sp. RSSA_27 TaxID=3447667 RepID=UPI003F3DEAE6
MKITPEQKSNIQKAFQKMNSKNDFLALLNEVKQMEYGKKCHPFTEKQLNYYINKDKFASDFEVIQALFPEEAAKKNLVHTGQGYTTFTIKKKSGGTRTIHAPQKGLKEFQKALNTILQNVHEPHKAATGFVLNKSIVDNAKVHVGQLYVYNLDLKDFFPSVDKSRVWGRLLVAPFHLENSVERKKIANMIAAITCTKMEVERYENNAWIKKICAVLPQGAPTSPTLTNAICEKMDVRLAGVAKRFGLKYTRYADDITFSSNHNNYEVTPNNFEKIFLTNSTFDMEVRRIIADQNFHVKESKVRLQKEGYRQEVTGLVVNDKVNVTRRYVKQLRQWLYYWETYGYEKAFTFFLQKYAAEKGHSKKGKPNMAMVLEGKLLYLKMVKGELDGTYLKLKERFDNLIDSATPINSILDIWETQGIEKAMETYYSSKKDNKKEEKKKDKNNNVVLII